MSTLPSFPSLPANSSCDTLSPACDLVVSPYRDVVGRANAMLLLRVPMPDVKKDEPDASGSVRFVWSSRRFEPYAMSARPLRDGTTHADGGEHISMRVGVSLVHLALRER